MTLPKDDAEHLKTLMIRLHNPRVKRHFKDVDDDVISQGPASIKTGCIVKPSDSLLIALARCWLFEVIVENASRMHPAMYATPIKQYRDEEEFEGKPQVLLFFEQDAGSTPNEFAKIKAEISFRLMNETNATMTEAKARAMATKIKGIFGATGPTYSWMKGDKIYNYQDKSKGYWLRIYAPKETEAKEIISRVLAIQNHDFEEDKFSLSQNLGRRSEDSPSGTRRVYGKSVRKKRWRPGAIVRFRYATLNMDGVDPVVLYDPYFRLRTVALVHETGR